MLLKNNLEKSLKNNVPKKNVEMNVEQSVNFFFPHCTIEKTAEICTSIIYFSF